MTTKPYYKIGLPAFLVLILIAIGNFLMSLWNGPALDDWTFMSSWVEINGSKPITFSTLFEFWKEIRLYDNGRLANVASPIFALFSPWKELFPFLTGLWVAYIVYSVCRFSFGRNGVKAFNIIIVWCSFFFLPWRNALYVNDYALNYIWATGITLLFMQFVVSQEEKGWSPLTFVAAFLLAFVAGGWHEGFAIPAVCGLFLLTVSRGFRFSPQWYVLGVFYALVAVVFYWCPGMLQRTSDQLGESVLNMSALKLCVDFAPVILLILTLLALMASRAGTSNLKEAYGNEWFAVGAGIVLTGSILSLLFAHQPRSSFFPDIMALAMFFIITRRFWRLLGNSSFKTYLGLLGLAFCVALMTGFLVWQYRFHKESEYILSEMSKSDSGTIFYDLIPKTEVPAYTLKVPRNEVWVTPYQFEKIREYFHYPYPAVVPRELNISNAREKGREIEGNLRAIQIGETLTIDGNPFKKPAINQIKVTTGDGEEFERIIATTPYLSPDGSIMTYVYVIDDIPEGEIRRIEVL